MTDRTDIEEMLSEAQQEQRQESVVAERRHRRKGLRRLCACFARHPRRNVMLSLVVVLGAIVLVPPLRYGLSGLFVTRDLRVTIVDEQTGEPVSNASVTIRGNAAQTDAEGHAMFVASKPGEPQVAVSKQYYQPTTSSVKVGVLHRTYEQTIRLSATGRAVPIRVTNRLSGEGVRAVSVTAGGTEVTTNSDGEATMVLDPAASSVEAELRADGYNTMRANLTVPGDVATNTIALTPAGRVYALSKQSGNLDVVKVNLDGSDRQVAVKATGNEEVNNTAVYASADWQFVVLKARREGTKAGLYLLDTSTDKLTDLDTGAVDFTAVGWRGHQFVYSTFDGSRQQWSAKQTELKVFDADRGERTTLMSSRAIGDSDTNYASQLIAGVFFVGDKLLYGVQWSGASLELAQQTATVQEVSLPGLTPRELRTDKAASLIMTQPNPTTVTVQVTTDKAHSYQYLNGTLADATITTEELLRAVPQYRGGPGGLYLWDESDNGAYQAYVADANLKSRHAVGPRGEFRAFGWYGSEYVLLSRNDSELFIVPATGAGRATPQKLTDYHRPPELLR